MKVLLSLIIIFVLSSCSQLSDEEIFVQIMDDEWSRLTKNNPVYAKSGTTTTATTTTTTTTATKTTTTTTTAAAATTTEAAEAAAKTNTATESKTKAVFTKECS